MEKPKITNTMAIMVVVLTFVYISAQLFLKIPDGNRDMVNIINGALLASYGMATGFYFTSTKSSEAKNETIKNLSEKILTLKT